VTTPSTPPSAEILRETSGQGLMSQESNVHILEIDSGFEILFRGRINFLYDMSPARRETEPRRGEEGQGLVPGARSRFPSESKSNRTLGSPVTRSRQWFYRSQAVNTRRNSPRWEDKAGQETIRQATQVAKNEGKKTWHLVLEMPPELKR